LDGLLIGSVPQVLKLVFEAIVLGSDLVLLLEAVLQYNVQPLDLLAKQRHLILVFV